MQTDLEKLAADMEEVMPYLLSGGAGALATSLAASGIKRKPKESRLAYLGKKLGIALGGGLAGAGIHKGINLASDSFKNALPADDVSTEEVLTNTATSPNLFRGLATGGAVAGATVAGVRDQKKAFKDLMPEVGHDQKSAFLDGVKGQPGEGGKLKNWIEQRARDATPGGATAGAEKALERAEKELDRASGDKGTATEKAKAKIEFSKAKANLAAEQAKNQSQMEKDIGGKVKRLGYREGEFADGKIQRAKSKTVNKIRRGFNTVAGKTTGSRLGRGLAIGTAAASPEILGALRNLVSGSSDNE